MKSTEALSPELHTAQVHQQELKRERDEAHEEIARLRSEIEGLKEKYHQHSLELQQVRLEAQTLSERLEEANNEREVLGENLEQEKDAHRGTRRELEGQGAELQSQVKTMGELRAQDREALERAALQIQELSERVDGLNRELRETIADRATLTERLRLLQEEATKEETGR